MTEVTRPGVVTVAVGLLGLEAVIQVLNAMASSAAAGPVIGVYQQYTDEVSVRHAWIVENNYAAMVWQGAVLAVIFAALALFLSFRSSIARIITWVVAGLLTLWTMMGFMLSSTAPLGSNANLPSFDRETELSQKVAAVVPAWAEPYAVIEGLATLAILLAVIVLLALPAASTFYRRKASAGAMQEARLAG